MLVVDGATDYLAGRSTDPATVGLAADDAAGTVTVDLTRPASDFVEVVGEPDVRRRPAGPEDRRGLPARGRASSGAAATSRPRSAPTG